MAAPSESAAQGSSRDEDDNEEDSSETGSFEEESEPHLKYERVANDVPRLLLKGKASCFVVHSKYIGLGTGWGGIYILNHDGYNIRNKDVSAHQVTVNDLSVDVSGEYLASCSDDGRVVIQSLFNGEGGPDSMHQYPLDRPIRSVAINPNYSQKAMFVSTEEDRVVLHEKGLFGRTKTTVLHQDDGPVLKVSWRTDLLVWASSKGVKVLDTTTKKRISQIPITDASNLCLVWRNSSTLLVAAGAHVSVCLIKTRAEKRPDLPDRFVEIIARCTLPMPIYSLAPFESTRLLVISRQKSEGITLSVLEAKMDAYEDIDQDVLQLKGVNGSTFQISRVGEEEIYFLLTSEDLIRARPRDADDHLDWLLENEHFEMALQDAQKNKACLKKHSLLSVAEKYVKYLLDEGSADEAAKVATDMYGTDKAKWEEEVIRFSRAGHLKSLSVLLPTGSPRLDATIYEYVLKEFIDKGQFDILLDTIRKWPADIYNGSYVAMAVLHSLDRHPMDENLQRTLATLYTHEGKFGEAVDLLLQAKSNEIFDVIERHRLVALVEDKTLQLMQISAPKTIKLFLDHHDKVETDKVVKQLLPHPRLLYEYLQALFERDAAAGKNHHNLQVRLLAEFDRERLLPFLRSSNHYILQEALDECQQRSYVQETVFLLARMGQRLKALQLMLQGTKDPEQSIAFCKEHHEEELWQELIHYSNGKPDFLTALLNTVGSYIDPAMVIRAIDVKLRIPGLRDSLCKILRDHELQSSLLAGAHNCLVADSVVLFERRATMQRRGILVDDRACGFCKQSLLKAKRGPAEGQAGRTMAATRLGPAVVVFFCRHAFHTLCLPDDSWEKCIICCNRREKNW